jgi:hypothetical protein
MCLPTDRVVASGFSRTTGFATLAGGAVLVPYLPESTACIASQARAWYGFTVAHTA